MVRKGPMELQTLEHGEIHRAEQWGRAVATTAADRLPGNATAFGG
jgi:hypothetical protein